MTKYTKYYQQMWEANKEILSAFQKTHDTYQGNQKDPDAKQQFDQKGKDVLTIFQEWDQRLCQQMERGHNGVFSQGVSEKFWNEVKKDFPLIELVGVQIKWA